MSRPYRFRDPEIAPDEIFLDASNIPAFDRGRLEGRLEAALSRRVYLFLAGGIFLALLVIAGQALNLQIVQGTVFAAQSARNSLRPVTLFAPRGAITDRNGEPLVTNESLPDGLTKRVYKAPGYGHLLGYVSYPKKDKSGNFYETETQGVAGVEATKNDALSGKNGQLLVEEDATGAVISQGTAVPAVAGATLKLSIDTRAQDAFYRAISELADRIPFQGGAGILMDAQTGELYALVTYPEYDSNVLSSGGPGDVIAAYSKDKRQPYVDRAVSGLYTPGSIVKPIEASGAYTDGIISPDKTIYSSGQISIPNPYDPAHPSIFRDWKALGAMDMRHAIAFSSDVYFYTVGGGFGDQKGLGIERLAFWFHAFGFDTPTGVDLDGENTGLIPTPAWKEKTFGEKWNIGNTYHTAIGQYSMQITPLEAVRAIAAVANGGKLVKPTIVAGQPVSGESIIVDPKGLQIAREGMRLGAKEGTSIGLNDLSFVELAGKTGTAQLGLHNEYYNAWAVGFWPYDHPKYVYAVVMEKGPAGNGIGGIYVMHQFLTELHKNAPEFFE